MEYIISEEQLNQLHHVANTLTVFNQLLEAVGRNEVKLTADALHSVSHELHQTLQHVLNNTKKPSQKVYYYE